jgi:signal transduction histidine kinase/ActR/RegA family two-component response regulator
MTTTGRRKKLSLGFRLVLCILAFLTLASLVTGFKNVRAEQKASLERLQTFGRALACSTALFSPIPVLEKDCPAIEGFLADLTKEYDDVEYVEVRRHDGVLLASIGEKKSAGEDDAESYRFTADVRAVAGDARALGKVELHLSPERFRAENVARIRNVVLQTVLTFLALGLLVFALLKRTVSRPLASLDRQAAALGAGDLDTAIHIDGGDELARLGETLDVMRLNLRGSYSMLESHAENLDRALQSAEVASRAKTEFLSAMSHELRTPLNGVIGMTEVLEKSGLTDEQKESVSLVRQSAAALLSTLSDVLIYADSDVGTVAVDIKRFAPRSLLDLALTPYVKAAHAKGIDIMWSVTTRVPTVVDGDAEKFRICIDKLVANAVKFTETGEIIVRLDAELRDQDIVALHGTVEDSGAGIDPSIAARLFEPFSLGDGSMSRRHGGIGLGLAIARRLARLMDGDIGYERRSHGGSRFWFHAIMSAAAGTETTPTPLCLDGRSVVVIDRSEAQRIAWTARLQDSGARVTAVASFREFEALAESLLHEIDAVLVDFRINLDYSGYLVDDLSALRSCARARIVLIDDRLSKPLHPAELAQLLARERSTAVASSAAAPTLGGEREISPSPGSAVPVGGEPPRILVAEDNLVNQRLARRILQQKGFVVDVAANGVEAVKCAKDAAYSLILMDCQMPEMDGFEATGEIRRLEGQLGRHFAIVAFTANALQSDRERCKSVGMDDFLSKPIDVAELDRVIRKFVHDVAS